MISRLVKDRSGFAEIGMGRVCLIASINMHFNKYLCKWSTLSSRHHQEAAFEIRYIYACDLLVMETHLILNKFQIKFEQQRVFVKTLNL